MTATMATDRVARDTFWHLLCHRSELPENGGFIKLEWLGEEVALYNDGGDIVVFDNLCPHRGTRFFTEASGQGALSCAYHGWSYAGGRMHIPCREQYSETQLRQAHLRTHQVDWCGDFLFAAIAPRMALDEQLGPTATLLGDISFNVNGRADFNAGVFDCDWRVALDNALEPLHLPFVHPDSLGQLALSDGRNELHAWSSVWYAEVGNARMARQLKAMGSLFQIDYQHPGYLSIYLFPFTMISSTFGYSYSLQNFFPSTEAGKTHFYSRLLKGATKSAAAAAALGAFFDSSAQVNRRVFAEDNAICARIAPAFSADPARGIYAASEAKVVHLHDCLARLDAH